MELALLLHIFPEGVEELDGAFAVYADEPPVGFDVLAVDDVREGWQQRWQEFHRPVQVGPLWVGPPWLDPPPDATAVVIDPGRAFGTGAHATTRLCLELLVGLDRGSVLDVGCGSGVLAIAAAKLGFDPVLALDLDPVAVETARANARANVVDVTPKLADALADPLPVVDVAVANLTAEAVEALGPGLRSRLLIASGYLDREVPAPAGFRRVERRVAEGWAAEVFARRTE